MTETSASKRMGTPTDVADLAALLLDPDGSFITGVLIDGGVIATMCADQDVPADLQR
ncbi:hypothetical protein MXD62_35980 [Frankia sp. Mgl5]|uniref:hypothetical protein n=1 Tax=Frankia sp. Mgl5 TaxID=2933793 RepID=UPI00200ED2F3|nr:hypothetical protein [Frankia sp. Mgl5]MCK9932479.1 hypothetical protein [Frankia sp. Mgl5]